MPTQLSVRSSTNLAVDTMLQQIECDRCGEAMPRGRMSCFDSICMDCFYRYYAFCTCCGTLLRRGQRRRNQSSRDNFLGGDCYIDPRVNQPADSVLCQCCYHVQGEIAAGARIDYWRPKVFDVSIATYKRIGSKRKFGVEIETSHCPQYYNLHDKTKFGCKGDCSISGLEFDSPILYGDEGLEYIEYFMEFATDHNWETDDDCGCHTHYDMRDENSENLFRIAYAYALTTDFWGCFVPRRRRSNSYCHGPSYTCRDIRAASRCENDFLDWCLDNDRYDYVNTGAYDEHGTFENRLLEGCLDSNDICSWVTIHCRFMDYVKGFHFNDLDQLFNKHPRHIFATLAGILDNRKLANWMAARSRQYERPLRGPGSASWTLNPRRQQSRRR